MPRPRKARPAKAPKPRNVAAKALGMGQFRPKVEADPKAYKRHPKHKPDTSSVPDEADDS